MLLVIAVKQSDCIQTRLYKTSYFDYYPSINELIQIGANININRGDKVEIEKVSEMIYNNINATWIRQ